MEDGIVMQKGAGDPSEAVDRSGGLLSPMGGGRN